MLPKFPRHRLKVAQTRITARIAQTYAVRTQVNRTLSLVNRPSVLRNIELYRATYDLTDLFSRYGVDPVLTGHDHYREQTVLKGVEYVIVDVLEEKTDNAGYAVVNVGRDIEVGFVRL